MTSLSTLNLKYIKAVYSSVKSNKPNIKPNCQPVILSFFYSCWFVNGETKPNKKQKLFYQFGFFFTAKWPSEQLVICKNICRKNVSGKDATAKMSTAKMPYTELYEVWIIS